MRDIVCNVRVGPAPARGALVVGVTLGPAPHLYLFYISGCIERGEAEAWCGVWGWQEGKRNEGKDEDRLGGWVELMLETLRLTTCPVRLS
jgi:hypothetical protein